MGGDDAAYNRNKLAEQWRDELGAIAKEDAVWLRTLRTDLSEHWPLDEFKRPRGPALVQEVHSTSLAQEDRLASRRSNAQSTLLAWRGQVVS